MPKPLYPGAIPNRAPASWRDLAGQAAPAHAPGDGRVLLPAALPGQRIHFGSGSARLAAYVSGPKVRGSIPGVTPMLLVHSVNAAASAAEVRPIYERAAVTRPVMALELPGFGSSNRDGLQYHPQLMSDAILAAAHEFRLRGFQGPVDLLAVSLSCEFAARAALAKPELFRSVSLVSPTGLESRHLERYESGLTKEKPWLRSVLERGPWSEALFRLLTSEPSMRMFLKRTWGSRNIDETLLAYNLLSVKAHGARHAPYAFIAGSLFTRGAAHLYEQLNLPVWVAHGVRGDFAKFDGLKTVQRTSAWIVDSFDTGAMPYFEVPGPFMDRLERFLGEVASSASTASPDSEAQQTSFAGRAGHSAGVR